MRLWAGSCSSLTRSILPRWDEIAGIFAHEAILKGSFDKYAEATAGKRGTAEVDAAFLQQIEQWRDDLAHNLALRNPGLTARELNFAVQRTIDRLIFLRICEDRGIEDPGRLRAVRMARKSMNACATCSGRPTCAITPGCFTSRTKRTVRNRPTG